MNCVTRIVPYVGIFYSITAILFLFNMTFWPKTWIEVLIIALNTTMIIWIVIFLSIGLVLIGELVYDWLMKG